MLNFMKYKLAYFLLSLAFLLPGAYFLIRYQLKPALDFTGGTLLEYQLPADSDQPTSLPDFTQTVSSIIQPDSIQPTGPDSFLIRSQSLDQQAKLQLQSALADQYGSITEKRYETIGPTLGRELIKKTLAGVLLAASFILFYVAYRFKDKKYGICAILAMLHDTFILLGIFSWLGFKYGVEVDALFVTAVLTILSFSVHDTVVVYDRIRETLKHQPKLRFVDVVNQSVTETLTRSINNSLTIIFMLLALYLLGGETIKWFVLALLIGTIAGTYSSTFTAAPLLVLWEEIKTKRGK